MRKTIIAAGLALATMQAQAAPITLVFEGTVAASTGAFSAPGSDLTGSITFDDGMTDVNPLTTQDGFTAAMDAGLPFSAIVMAGVTGTATSATLPASSFSYQDSVGFDQFIYTLNDVGSSQAEFNLTLVDPNMLGVGQSNLTGSPMPFEHLFSNTSVARAGALRITGLGTVNFTVDSIAVVPLPAAFWLFVTGLGCLGFMQRSRRRSLAPVAS